jgi:hypothetical protein
LAYTIENHRTSDNILNDIKDSKIEECYETPRYHLNLFGRDLKIQKLYLRNMEQLRKYPKWRYLSLQQSMAWMS